MTMVIDASMRGQYARAAGGRVHESITALRGGAREHCRSASLGIRSASRRLICAVLAGSGFDSTASAQSVIDYDADDDGLIEVTDRSPAQRDSLGYGRQRRRGRRRLRDYLLRCLPDRRAADGLPQQMLWLRTRSGHQLDQQQRYGLGADRQQRHQVQRHLRGQRAHDQQPLHQPHLREHHRGQHGAVRSHRKRECDPQCEADERGRDRERQRRGAGR